MTKDWPGEEILMLSAFLSFHHLVDAIMIFTQYLVGRKYFIACTLEHTVTFAFQFLSLFFNGQKIYRERCVLSLQHKPCSQNWKTQVYGKDQKITTKWLGNQSEKKIYKISSLSSLVCTSSSLNNLVFLSKNVTVEKSPYRIPEDEAANILNHVSIVRNKSTGMPTFLRLFVHLKQSRQVTRQNLAIQQHCFK